MCAFAARAIDNPRAQFSQRVVHNAAPWVVSGVLAFGVAGYGRDRHVVVADGVARDPNYHLSTGGTVQQVNLDGPRSNAGAAIAGATGGVNLNLSPANGQASASLHVTTPTSLRLS